MVFVKPFCTYVYRRHNNNNNEIIYNMYIKKKFFQHLQKKFIIQRTQKIEPFFIRILLNVESDSNRQMILHLEFFY